MATNGGIEAGFARVDFTPAPGLTLMGQMHERIGERVHDLLTATAMALRSGSETVALVSVDICFMDAGFVREVQARVREIAGLPEERLLLHATHTHVAPTVVTLLTSSADPAFRARLRNSIAGAVATALERLEPVDIYSGSGHMEQMGWNRRAMFADGTSRMYGHAAMPGFAGIEGPRDPHLGVLFARNGRGAIPGVVVNFSTHPNCLENESFYSADIPGAARRSLQSLLGEETVVLYLTGAAGNTAPSILDPYTPEQPWRGEAGLERSGLYLAGEAAKVIASAVAPDPDPVLRVARTTFQVPLRPWPRPGDRTHYDWDVPYYKAAAADWPRRLAEENPVELSLNVVRVGDTAICTNPAELFVEYGLEIRSASPATVTMVAQLTDGYVGYVPTLLAFERGGYETWTAPSSQLDPEAGAQIVAATQEMLQHVHGGTTVS